MAKRALHKPERAGNPVPVIDRYRHVPYAAGGRTMDGLDCWGLVVMVRRDITGQKLPSYACIPPKDKRNMTLAAGEVSASLSESSAVNGSIAFAYRGRVCVHVGIIVEADGRLWVFETDDPTGPVLTPVSRFVNRYVRVEFYD